MPRVRAAHKNVILLILALAQFMVVLDVSIVNVALPSIYRGLHFHSDTSLQWIITAYTLAFGGFLLLGGRAADLYGRKRIFLGGVTFFAICSLICGLSQNSAMIEIVRAFQGLAAAFMSPAALSIVLTTFKEGKERNTAVSVWGAVAAGGAATGVLLGGVLTQYLGWRWNFFINVPVGIFVVLAAIFYVPESKADLDHSQLDLPGAALVTLGLMSLVYGLTEAPTHGWTSSTAIGFIGASVVLLALFIYNEARVKHPLLPFSIFRIRNIAGANITQFPITASLFSMFFFLTLYVQDVLGYSQVKSGFSFLPITVIIGIVAVLMSNVIGKIGYKKPLIVAPLFMGAGLLLLSHIPVHGSYFRDVFPGLAIMAVGIGMSFISITIAATNGVPHKESGIASGILNTSQQVGGSLGLAILSGVASSTVVSYLKHRTATPQNLIQAQVVSYHHAFLVGVLFAAFAFLCAIFLIHEKKGEKIDPSAAAL